MEVVGQSLSKDVFNDRSSDDFVDQFTAPIFEVKHEVGRARVHVTAPEGATRYHVVSTGFVENGAMLGGIHKVNWENGVATASVHHIPSNWRRNHAPFSDMPYQRARAESVVAATEWLHEVTDEDIAVVMQLRSEGGANGPYAAEKLAEDGLIDGVIIDHGAGVQGDRGRHVMAVGMAKEIQSLGGRLLSREETSGAKIHEVGMLAGEEVDLLSAAVDRIVDDARSTDKMWVYAPVARLAFYGMYESGVLDKLCDKFPAKSFIRRHSTPPPLVSIAKELYGRQSEIGKANHAERIVRIHEEFGLPFGGIFAEDDALFPADKVDDSVVEAFEGNFVVRKGKTHIHMTEDQEQIAEDVEGIVRDMGIAA